MKIIKTILIDDEPNNNIYLQGLLNQHFPEINIVGITDNATDGIVLIKELEPKLIFLDVEMPGTTGFELLQQLQPINFEVVFVTAYNHYALQAFEVNAIGYITKPIAVDKFKQTVKTAINRIQEKNINKNILQIFEQSQQQHNETKIALPTLSGLVFIKQNDIIYCESNGNYTQFYLKDNKKILVSRQLGEYEKLLPEIQFIRTHDKYIINLQYIAEYIKGNGGEIKFDDGNTLPVAARRKDELLHRFDKWLKRK